MKNTLAWFCIVGIPLAVLTGLLCWAFVPVLITAGLTLAIFGWAHILVNWALPLVEEGANQTKKGVHRGKSKKEENQND